MEFVYIIAIVIIFFLILLNYNSMPAIEAKQAVHYRPLNRSFDMNMSCHRIDSTFDFQPQFTSSMIEDFKPVRPHHASYIFPDNIVDGSDFESGPCFNTRRNVSERLEA